MAPIYGYVYDLAKRKIVTGEINLQTHAFKLMLATSVYVPSKTGHSLLSEVTPYEASGAGYTAGGWALTTTFSQSGVSGTITLDATDFIAEALSANWRWAVVYDNTHASKALLCYISPGSPQTPGGLNYQFTFNANGLLTLADG